MKIRTKLLICFLVPAIGLFGFSGFDMWHSYKAYQHTEAVLEIEILADKASSVIDSLAMERGKSNVFLSSVGESKKAIDLDGAWGETDIAVNVFLEEVKLVPFDEFSPEFKSSVDGMVALLNKLDEERSAVKAEEKMAEEVFEYYTDLVDAMMDSVVVQMAGMMPDSKTAAEFASYVSLLEAKERLARIRGQGAAAIADLTIDYEEVATISELIGEEHAFLENFKMYAEEGVIKAYKKLEEREGVQKAFKYQKALMTVTEAFEFEEFTVPEWFDAIEYELVALREMQNLLFEDIAHNVEGFAEDKKGEFVMILWMTVGLLLLSIATLFFVNRSIAKSLSGAVKDLDESVGQQIAMLSQVSEQMNDASQSMIATVEETGAQSVVVKENSGLAASNVAGVAAANQVFDSSQEVKAVTDKVADAVNSFKSYVTRL